ncbi:hypothetical protein BX616_011110 [Lobosporangium transversale]|nr:hypothetical protein BX616_011110 [Lobosporangium transversale]
MLARLGPSPPRTLSNIVNDDTDGTAVPLGPLVFTMEAEPADMTRDDALQVVLQLPLLPFPMHSGLMAPCFMIENDMGDKDDGASVPLQALLSTMAIGDIDIARDDDPQVEMQSPPLPAPSVPQGRDDGVY